MSRMEHVWKDDVPAIVSLALFGCGPRLYRFAMGLEESNSPIVGVRKLKARLGQFHLLLLDDKSQHVLIREVPVRLGAKFKKFPDGHPHRPGKRA